MSRVTGSLAILVPDSVAQAPIPQLFDPIDLPPSFSKYTVASSSRRALKLKLLAGSLRGR